MAGHAVEHDYHLIPPSPWPFLSGCACLVWGLGMVVFFAGLVDRTGESPMMEWFFGNGLDTLKSTMVGDGSVSGGWIILLIGCLFASYVMYGWWKDVAAESEAGDHTRYWPALRHDYVYHARSHVLCWLVLDVL